jgi:hypothetical protein
MHQKYLRYQNAVVLLPDGKHASAPRLLLLSMCAAAAAAAVAAHISD